MDPCVENMLLSISMTTHDSYYMLKWEFIYKAFIMSAIAIVVVCTSIVSGDQYQKLPLGLLTL